MSTLGSCCRANFPSTESSTAGLSLLAQPAALTISVRRGVLTSDMLSSILVQKREGRVPRFRLERCHVGNLRAVRSQGERQEHDRIRASDGRFPHQATATATE